MRTPAGTRSPHIVSLRILEYVREVGQNKSWYTFSWEFRKVKLVQLTHQTNSKLRNINWSKVVRWLAEIPLDIVHPSSLDQKHILTNVDQSRPTLTNYLTNFDQYFVKSGTWWSIIWPSLRKKAHNSLSRCHTNVAWSWCASSNFCPICRPGLGSHRASFLNMFAFLSVHI